MRRTSIALVCALGAAQAWAEHEDKELVAAHSSLPSNWKLCEVFTLRNRYTSDRLLTTSKSEAEKVRKTTIRIKNRLGPFELGIGAAFVKYSPGTTRKFFKTLTEGSERPQYEEEKGRGFFYLLNYDPDYMGPVYRLFNNHHFYTMSAEECEVAKSQGWTYEGIAGFLVRQDRIEAFRHRYQVPAGEPWYRLYKKDHNDHFYTTSHGESKSARRELGFTDEGVLGYIH